MDAQVLRILGMKLGYNLNQIVYALKHCEGDEQQALQHLQTESGESVSRSADLLNFPSRILNCSRFPIGMAQLDAESMQEEEICREQLILQRELDDDQALVKAVMEMSRLEAESPAHAPEAEGAVGLAHGATEAPAPSGLAPAPSGLAPAPSGLAPAPSGLAPQDPEPAPVVPPVDSDKLLQLLRSRPSNENLASEFLKFINKLENAVKCSICWETCEAFAPFYMCPEGHHFCYTCYKSIPFVEVYDRLNERKIDSYKRRCKICKTEFNWSHRYVSINFAKSHVYGKLIFFVNFACT